MTDLPTPSPPSPPSPSKRTRTNALPPVVTVTDEPNHNRSNNTNNTNDDTPQPSSTSRPLLLPTTVVTSLLTDDEEENTSKDEQPFDNSNEPVTDVQRRSVNVNDSATNNVVVIDRRRPQEQRQERQPSTTFGRCNGQVRRMSSILDIRMGSLAYGSPRSWDKFRRLANVELEMIDDDDYDFRGAKELDVFGIPIPTDDKNEDMNAQGVTRRLFEGAGVSRDLRACGETVICESMSQFDLSELMC